MLDPRVHRLPGPELADAHADRHRPRVEKGGPGDGAAELVREDGGWRLLGVGQQEQAFLAADAKQQIELARAPPYQRNDSLEHAVALRMAQLIVDAFEVIDVDDQQRSRGRAAPLA